MKEVLILKVGTATITNSESEIDEEVIAEIARQLALLHEKYNLILVSSGAVGAGRKDFRNFTGKIVERRASAAIGNPILIRKYAEAFETYKISVAQALCERHHFSNRPQFLQLKETFQALWQNGTIPIVNENDVVSSHELKFSDNDELATLLATSFSASKLLLGTSSEGLLDGEKLIEKVEKFDEKVFSLVRSEKSEFGLGGMLSKLHCARLATNLGTSVVIFQLAKPGNVLLAEEGRVGTQCPAKVCNISAHQKWIASGSLSSGKVIIDQGAGEALKKRKSLLMVGVKRFEGSFEKGDILKIYLEGHEDPEETFGMARAKLSSDEISTVKALDEQGVELSHADGIVIF